MPPKRKAAEAVAPATKRASRATTAVVQVEPPAKGKAKAEPQKKAVKAAKAEPPKKAVAKKGKGKGPDPEEFVDKLLDVCKVLITICKTTVSEDERKGTITTVADYATYGKGLLALLPADARLPMMKMANVYMEAINEMAFAIDEEDLEDDEDDEDEDVAAGLEDDLMLPEHFYQFKQYFEPEAAVTFMKKVDDVMEAALDKMVGNLEQSDFAAAAEEEDDEDDANDEDPDDWTDHNVAWKGE